MIGPSEGPVRLFAQRCSWCRTWSSREDEAAAKAGLPISHTICPDCEARIRKEDEDAEEVVVLFYVAGLLVLVAALRILTWIRRAWRSIDWSGPGRGAVLTWGDDDGV